MESSIAIFAESEQNIVNPSALNSGLEGKLIHHYESKLILNLMVLHFKTFLKRAYFQII
jgi:hypothetical protein